MGITGQVLRYESKKGVVWRIRIDRGRDPVTGKRLLPYHPETFATERAAKRKLAQLIAEAEKGTQAEPNRMTVRELMIEWLDGPARREVRKTTLQDYESTVRLHVLPALGNARLQSLTTPALQRFHDGLLSSGVSVRTAQVALQRVRSALGYAMQMQYVSYNAAVGVRIARAAHREMAVWTPAQVSGFLRVARGQAYHPLWDLALATGMRRGELIGLRWADVDFERRLISVRRTVEPVPGGLEVFPPKNGRSRTVDVDSDIIGLLREHRAQQGALRLKAGDAWGDASILLASGVGTWITPDNVSRAFSVLVGRAGVPRIRVHDMRHTAATLMLLAEVPIKVISERLGHASIQITMDLYAHLLPGMGKDAAEAVRRILKAAGA